jgi:hypothetical protein
MDALGEDVRLLGKHFATLARFEEAMQSKVVMCHCNQNPHCYVSSRQAPVETEGLMLMAVCLLCWLLPGWPVHCTRCKRWESCCRYEMLHTDVFVYNAVSVP